MKLGMEGSSSYEKSSDVGTVPLPSPAEERSRVSFFLDISSYIALST